MAEAAIHMPSPSLFLSSSDPSPSTPASAHHPARSPQQTSQTAASKASDSNPGSKRKLSKSRNGCITCKAKRLKCDETKPTCNQCARRSVQCGGYKKDFKWRAFEEASFTGKPSGKPKKNASSPPVVPLHAHSGNPTAADEFYAPFPNHAFTAASYAPTPSPVFYHGPSPNPPFVDPPYTCPPEMYIVPATSSYMQHAVPISPVDHFTPITVESHSTFEAESIGTVPSKTTAPSSVASGQSPRLMDLLLPGTDLSEPPEEYLEFRSQYPASFYEPTGFTPPAEEPDDDIEEIPRIYDSDWHPRLPSPTPSSSSSSSSGSHRRQLIKQPQFSSGSPEMLTRRFDQETCGVLSVKDGPTENPWRMLIWPLARDCPALYYAIASMTSFHQSRDSRIMRYHGIEHMRLSMHELRSSLEKNTISIDAAISTTLALGFSESWDQHIKTGMDHIKGARTLIDTALVQHQQRPKRGEELDRLKFLCNTWVYMNVIARLTSADDDDSNDFDSVFDVLYSDGQTDTQLDPLMGCAGSLFPIIGRVANLARKARRTRSNSITMISQAAELKKQLDDWNPPSTIEDPEDESTSPDDVQRTAYAYKYATLLYLHQAVPEIPSLPAAVLAEKTLRSLASVRLSSRSVIVSIFPLMAAGCEATSKEDRDWVDSRWEMLSKRMKLGILEKCQEVTKEVWLRRDAHAETQAQLLAEDLDGRDEDDILVSPTNSLKRGVDSLLDETEGDWADRGTKRRAVEANRGMYDTPQAFPIKLERSDSKRSVGIEGEELGSEFSVRGRLHWLSVMKEWQWEILLG